MYFNAMKGEFRNMLKTLGLSLTVLLSFLGTAVFAQDQAPAPSYTDGDAWQFNAIEKEQVTSSTRSTNGDFKVIFKGTDNIRVVPVGQEKSGFKRSSGELRRMLAGSDEEKFLVFPLTVSKKWSSDFQDDLRGGATVNTHAEMVVSGYEEVTTDAGKFKAFKIERSETSGGGGKGRNASSKSRRVDYVYYYSPETRSIVKLHRLEGSGATRDIELIKYTPAK